MVSVSASASASASASLLSYTHTFNRSPFLHPSLVLFVTQARSSLIPRNPFPPQHELLRLLPLLPLLKRFVTRADCAKGPHSGGAALLARIARKR
ncbi:hypothetical protein BO70DRAFT_184663 [Aspergillus heteromorphus CBS 117.55]|uniref:Uncharacterized protein n=1 Tax=Aspergillus heteromorphus CBS 117.55 TaxID=1448321 RepID=A0A317WPX8_9EURO|nr:uncharacterized protein BO70DRAFT_184663 [Aspergillus heteromorphus CBS 117.55]PWY88554.1 hypothetical protein BO70DRAFT_184663 [Aspergillus heteromorphus CBS 117.55]